MPGSGRDAWFQGGAWSGGGTWSRWGLLPGGGVWYPTCTEPDSPPGQMATAADGMHPTGMHSCFDAVFMK